MSTVKFTKEHEWVKIEGDTATIGISEYAQSQLGDVVFVELPAKGKQLQQFKEAAVVESVKAASDVYSPMSGEVIGFNDKLPGNPGLINQSPLGDGWFFKIKIANQNEIGNLMSEDEYKKYIQGL
jgi:glycine cleavage system H protein